MISGLSGDCEWRILGFVVLSVIYFVKSRNIAIFNEFH